MRPSFWMFLLVLVLIAMLSGCGREERRFQAERHNAGPSESAMRQGINVDAGTAKVFAVIAFSESSLHRGEPESPDHDGAHPPVPRRFLADIAAAVAGLSCLVILAMWFALWVNGPCEFF